MVTPSGMGSDQSSACAGGWSREKQRRHKDEHTCSEGKKLLISPHTSFLPPEIPPDQEVTASEPEELNGDRPLSPPSVLPPSNPFPSFLFLLSVLAAFD